MDPVAVARRGRHSTCRGCSAAAKREWRWRYATTCRSCGGSRGADSDYYADRVFGNRTGLCRKCFRARHQTAEEAA